MHAVEQSQNPKLTSVILKIRRFITWKLRIRNYSVIVSTYL